MYEEIFSSLPVIINDCYGDPFFPKQLDNTLEKLYTLRNHNGPIGVISKMPLKSKIIDNIKKYLNPNVFIYYSLTGLNEGNISFEDRENTFRDLYSIHPNTIMYFRPIIPGRNDSIENILRIINISKDTSKVMVYGGFKCPNSRERILSASTKNILSSLASENGIRVFPKTSCATAELFNTVCVSHVNEKPINLDVIRALGYNFKLNTNSEIELDKGSYGDRNFIRFITHSQPLIKDIVNNDILSISKKVNHNSDDLNSVNNILECTSSWFLWSRNIDSCIGCDYCMVTNMDHLKTYNNIGCNPVHLGKLVS